MTEEDRCNVCGCILNETNWLPGNRRHNRKRCKVCDVKRVRSNRANHTFEQRLREKIGQSLRQHKLKGIDIIGSNKEFMHTYTGHCALCGEEFDLFADDRRHKGSIDRINNDSYMTPDNIQWLCYSCNTGKQDMTNEEYIAKCKRIIERVGGE